MFTHILFGLQSQRRHLLLCEIVMDEKLLEVGDLVRPCSKIFQDYYDRFYKSPGVLVGVIEVHNRKCYEIYWSDGTRTTEHVTYIKKVEE